MADQVAEKIKRTQNSFPPQKPGAVAECPFKQKAAETTQAPVTTRTAFHLTQQLAQTLGMRGAAQPAKEKKDWIEILLVDMDGKPVPNVRYRVTLPDGAVQEGRLNEHGQAGYYKIDAGTCKVTFPDLDKDAWD